MDAPRIAALLDEAAGERVYSNLGLARQLQKHVRSDSPVLPHAGDLSSIRRYTNEQAAQFARAVRASLGYEVWETASDLLDRLEANFRIHAAVVDCDHANGGSLVTERHRLIFCSTSTDDPGFQMALECGRLFASLANWTRDIATVTIADGARRPRKHHFAHRFAAELLIPEELLGRAISQARHDLGNL